MIGRTHDLGMSFELQEYRENDNLIGYFVTGPRAPNCKRAGGLCGGLCAIKPYNPGGVHEYEVWKVEGDWPNITLKPSVKCECGGQHGFVRNGCYEKA